LSKTDLKKSNKSSDRVSAGILVYRWNRGDLEVLIAHPGGPFFAAKDYGAWTIPKGEPKAGEDLTEAAVREFSEEVGFTPTGPFTELGSIKQKGGKIVHAWACEGDLPNGHVHQCNTFRMEWPLNSGEFQSFPEIDQACFFSIHEARRKLKEAQLPLLDRLLTFIQHYRRDQD
jgi:predicted NUDIX family NTP pyrophosphohydrolase